MTDVKQRLADHLKSPSSVPKYEQFYSTYGANLLPTRIRLMANKVLMSKDTLVPLSAGFPHPTIVSPILNVDLHMKDGRTLRISEEDVRAGCNYGISDGYPPLTSWLEKLQKQEHNPPQTTRIDHPEPFKLAMVSGITEGMRCTFDMLLDEDDTILVETEVFCTTMSMLKMKCHMESVRHDDQGMLVDHLDEILSTWRQRHPGRKFPKLLYAITAGNNPTGYSWSLSRLLGIYQLCRKYNILIAEDAAYFYIQYDERLSSFQSIDVDARVIRMDTFSKILGGGFRMGWVSGPETLIKKISTAVEFISLSPNKFSQMIIYNILRSWGYETFNKKVKEIAKFYQRRAQLMCKAAEKHLTGLATWSVPKAGMFLWLELKGIEDSTAISDKLLSKKVSVLPGNLFTPDSEKSPAMRVSYSIVDESDMDKSLQVMAEVIRQHIASS